VGERVARFFAGPVMTFAGVMHFLKPRWYMRIMPPYLPAHRELVYASGVAEIAGALGTMHPRTRRPAGLFLIATLVAVFPANVHMALHPEDFRDVPGGAGALYARLPLQGLFVYWVWRATSRRRALQRS
jgi:uncharacterized membrane protein